MQKIPTRRSTRSSSRGRSSKIPVSEKKSEESATEIEEKEEAVVAVVTQTAEAPTSSSSTTVETGSVSQSQTAITDSSMPETVIVLFFISVHGVQEYH